MNNKRLIADIVKIALGAALSLSPLAGMDEFWSGMGAALIFLGILSLVRGIRYRTNEEYREAVTIAQNDERNKYLSTKAWACAGYLFVMVAAVATIALKIAGLEEYLYLTSGSVCLLLVLYWISYLYLRRKY